MCCITRTLRSLLKARLVRAAAIWSRNITQRLRMHLIIAYCTQYAHICVRCLFKLFYVNFTAPQLHTLLEKDVNEPVEEMTLAMTHDRRRGPAMPDVGAGCVAILLNLHLNKMCIRLSALFVSRHDGQQR